jgi:organic radical activating enzyme
LSKKGFIKEVFSSYQGEGKYVGAKQIFIRFAGCNINCKGCDTDYKPEKNFNIENYTSENSVFAEDLYNILMKYYNFQEFHSVSFTGGEPLEQLDFLINLAKLFKKDKIKLFLETSGFYAEKLLIIMNLFDIFSIDIKLTSVFGVKFDDNLFKILKEMPKTKYYLKMVLDNKVDFNELYEVLFYMEDLGVNEIYVQPFNDNLSFETLSEINKIFTKKRINLLFVPQLHKMLRIK